jgi:YD repeat-containing protein
MTYNSVGQLIGARDAKGNVANYEYDTAGRMTKIDYPHDTDVTMSYDALGRLSTKTDGLGTTEYSYDNLNRLTSEDGPWENDTISYNYDALGRQTALSINGSTQAAYSYDAFDRLTQVSSGAQNFGYSYNGASSQLTQLTLPGGGKTEYSYDAMQHLTQVQSLKSDGTTNLAKFDYSYNTRDVRTSVEKQIGANAAQTVNYTYDTTDQLTKELSTEQNPTLNKEYSYDAMGNRITSSVSGASTSYTSNNLNQITQTTLGGNNTAITYDANGNMTAEGNKTFGYNDADQLTSIVIQNQKKSEFVYDSDGRKRISKEYTWDAAANAGAGAWISPSPPSSPTAAGAPPSSPTTPWGAPPKSLTHPATMWSRPTTPKSPCGWPASWA